MDAGVREVAGQRLPALGLLALLCLLEIAFDHGGERTMLALAPLPIVVSMAAAASLRVPALRRRADVLAFACVATLGIAVTCSAAAAASLERVPLDLAVLALAGAAVFPWGAGIQSLLGAAFVAAAALAAHEAAAPPATGPAIAHLTIAVGVSILVAALTHTHVAESVQITGAATRRSAALARRADDADRELQRRGLALERALEEAEKANVAKARFVGNMSHELRTPLNAILGFARMLLDEAGGPLQAKQRDYLGEIVVAAGHLLRKVEGVLRHARGEADGDPLERTDIPLDLLAAAAVRHAAPDAAAKRITIRPPERSGLHVTGDRTRLLHVLLNLLSNAICFTAEGGEVGVDVRGCGEDAELVVWDRGIGIAADDRERIFLPFEQVAGATQSAQKGTGLGLTTCKRVVEAHGGVIRVESRLGGGSRFVVTLPQRIAAAEAPHAAAR